jgi:hypothetical protein
VSSLSVDWQKQIKIKPALRFTEEEEKLLHNLVFVLKTRILPRTPPHLLMLAPQPMSDLTHRFLTGSARRIDSVILAVDQLFATFKSYLKDKSKPASMHNAIVRGYRFLIKYYNATFRCIFYRLAISACGPPSLASRLTRLTRFSLSPPPPFLSLLLSAGRSPRPFRPSPSAESPVLQSAPRNELADEEAKRAAGVGDDEVGISQGRRAGGCGRRRGGPKLFKPDQSSSSSSSADESGWEEDEGERAACLEREVARLGRLNSSTLAGPDGLVKGGTRLLRLLSSLKQAHRAALLAE